MKLDRKVKTALNETRLLILGAQVLLGFQFEAFFQDGFSELSAASQRLCLVGLMLVLLSVTLLVMPSMQHRLIEMGQSSERLVSATSTLTTSVLCRSPSAWLSGFMWWSIAILGCWPG